MYYVIAFCACTMFLIVQCVLALDILISKAKALEMKIKAMGLFSITVLVSIALIFTPPESIEDCDHFL